MEEVLQILVRCRIEFCQRVPSVIGLELEPHLLTMSKRVFQHSSMVLAAIEALYFLLRGSEFSLQITHGLLQR